MRLRYRRQGNVLALVAVCMFLFAGIAALALDLAFASLSRRQMQTAVNTAALEGLRGRDDPGGATIGRDNASQFTALQFDDDLDPGNGDLLSLGAGPVVNYQDGIPLPNTSFQASRLITANNLSIYKPEQSSGTPGLEVNANNDAAGDMVSGNYNPTTTDHSEAPSDSPTPYARADFTPAATGYNAFLVRMRRTGEPAEGGVVSAGPALPSFFGRGSISSTDMADRQERGTFVRATAIAQAVPVMSAGPTSPSTAPQPIPGVAPLALDATFWQGLPFGASTVKLNTTTGELTSNAATVGWLTQLTELTETLNPGDTVVSVASTAGFPITYPFHIRIDQEIIQVSGLAAAANSWTVTRDPTMAAAHQDQSPVRQADVTVIGEPFIQGTFNGFPAGLDSQDLYVPLHRLINGQDLIVGFGYAQIRSDSAGDQITLTKMDRIAEMNASVTLAIPIAQVNPALASADIDALFTANANLAAPANNPGNALRSPALVRSMR